MAITHVGSVSTLVLNTASVGLDLAAVAWQPGDVALIRCGAVRVFDVPAGWTQDLFLQPGGLTRYQGFWRVLQAGDPDVWTVTLSSGQVRNITAGLTVKRGVDQTTPINVQGDAAGEVAPSVVTTVADTAVLRTWFGLNSGSAFTVPGGVVQRWNEFSATSSAVDMAHADAAQAAAGATGTATATVTSPGNPWAATTALAPAAGGVEPAEGTGAYGVGFDLDATGARDSAAAGGFELGLALAGTGARQSAAAAAFGLGLQLAAAGQAIEPGAHSGQATFSLGLSLAATGLTMQVDSASGQVAAGLGLQLAAAGARPSAGGATFALALGLAASTVIVAPTPPERTSVVPAESRTLVVAAESRTQTVPRENRRGLVPA